jgi:hypothetical protein
VRAIGLCAVLVACSTFVPRVSAGPLAAGGFFQFSTSVTPTTTPEGSATVTLTGLSSDFTSDNLDATGAGTDIVFGTISVSGLNHSTSAQSVSIDYTFTVTIGDFPDFNPPGSGPAWTHEADFVINGTVSGSIGPGNKSNISTNVYTLSSITQPVGAVIYKVDLSGPFTYVPPGQSGFPGQFGAHVELTTATIPEPGSLTLAGLGALALVFPAYRRWWRTARRNA